MKRFIALILTGILLLTFAGCSNSGNTSSGSTEESKARKNILRILRTAACSISLSELKIP